MHIAASDSSASISNALGIPHAACSNATYAIAAAAKRRKKALLKQRPNVVIKDSGESPAFKLITLPTCSSLVRSPVSAFLPLPQSSDP